MPPAIRSATRENAVSIQCRAAGIGSPSFVPWDGRRTSGSRDSDRAGGHAGLLAERLRDTDIAEVRDALRGGKLIRWGQGYSVRVPAPHGPLFMYRLLKASSQVSEGRGPARMVALPKPSTEVRRAGVQFADPRSLISRL